MPTKENLPDLRYNSSENNPCWKEHLLSMECLSDSKYDHSKCTSYFENYKTCKGFWNKIRNERLFKGIIPALPPLEEREKMKKEFLESRNNKHINE